jgi:hypothetical protein
MTIQNVTQDSNSVARITAIHIDCNAARNTVTSTLVQEPEQVTVHERKRLPNGKDEICESVITIHSRSFPAYAACPVSTARKLAADARRMFPSVPVTLYNA